MFFLVYSNAESLIKNRVGYEELFHLFNFCFVYRVHVGMKKLLFKKMRIASKLLKNLLRI